MWSELQNMTSWMKSWDWKLLLALVPCTNRVFKVSKILWNVDPDVHPETLVWSDEFDTLDESKWTHLVTTHPLVRLWRIVSSTPHILIQFRMIFNITAITGPTAGSVRARYTWCRPSPPWSMARTSCTAAALTSTPRWVRPEAASQFLFHCLPLQDPEHPCNIWYDQDNLCSDCSGQDIVKPIQLARLHSKVSRNQKE